MQYAAVIFCKHDNPRHPFAYHFCTKYSLMLLYSLHYAHKQGTSHSKPAQRNTNNKHRLLCCEKYTHANTVTPSWSIHSLIPRVCYTAMCNAERVSFVIVIWWRQIDNDESKHVWESSFQPEKEEWLGVWTRACIHIEVKNIAVRNIAIEKIAENVVVAKKKCCSLLKPCSL